MLSLQDWKVDLSGIVRRAQEQLRLKVSGPSDEDQMPNDVWWSCGKIVAAHPHGERVLCDIIREEFPSPPAGFEKVGKGRSKSESSGGFQSFIERVRFWPPTGKAVM